MNQLAIVAVTPRGIELGNRLAQGLGGEVVAAEDDLQLVLQRLFTASRPLVCIMALGIVVRIIGPVAKNKNADPAVVVVDEAGRYAISVLGGHAAGANRLAQQVAHLIGATPVITTASDVLGLPAVDMIGRSWGWRIEGRENLNAVAAAVVRGEPIGVFQETGRRDWWQEFGAWPSSWQWLSAWPPDEDTVDKTWSGVLVINDRLAPLVENIPTVVFRPPSLVVGVGCRRGEPYSAIEQWFQHVCQTHGFSPLSLGAVATASLKANEPGLQEFAARHGVPLKCFELEELAAVGPLPTPSRKVHEKIGVFGVAEPAAMLAAKTFQLLAPKCRGKGVVMALARRENV